MLNLLFNYDLLLHYQILCDGFVYISLLGIFSLMCWVIIVSVKRFSGQSGSPSTNKFSEADLPSVSCEKHPGHRNFISAKTFKMEDLPEGYRRRDLFRYIQTFKRLVVKIKVATRSEKRLHNLEISSDVHMEKDGTSFGTGLIWHKRHCCWITNRPCPCAECRERAKPRQQWGKVCVRTANHVVYDSEEARATTALLDSCGDSPRTVALSGYKMISSDAEEDTCEVAMAVHSKKFYGEIIKDIGACRRAKRKRSALERLAVFQGGDFLTIIISHPHGKGKHVSIGRSKYRTVEGAPNAGVDAVSYTYDTPTCSGSSGAPVLLVGLERLTISFAPHSGCRRANRNVSGVGLEVAEEHWLTAKKSPLFYIIRNGAFNWKQKIHRIVRLVKVKLRKMYSHASLLVGRSHSRKSRKPNSRMVKKIREVNKFTSK